MPNSPLRLESLPRARVHSAFGRLMPRLTDALRGLAQQLLSRLDEDGKVCVATVHKTLFPVATETKMASAQLSNLLKAIEAAASQEGLTLQAAYRGAKNAGVAQRQLFFHRRRA